MGYFIGVNLSSSERFVYTYNCASQAELESAIDMAMMSAQYKHLGRGIYEKGSRTKRILFGAFCKYFKVQIAIDSSNPQNTLVSVKKESSGMSGGLIGVSQAKSEMTYLTKLFEAI